MGKIQFEQQLQIPRDLITVAQTTGNDILDLGYQCTDQHPYFAFGEDGSFFTKINPSRAFSISDNNEVGIKVNVYQGNQYKMTYIGTGTQLRQTLTYNGTNYSYKSNSNVNAREYKINPWSLHKPIEKSGVDNPTSWIGSTAISSESYKPGHAYGVTLNFDKIESGSVGDRICGADFVFYKPNPPYRLRDFDGYDPDAKPDIYAMEGQTRANGYYIQLTLNKNDSADIKLQDVVPYMFYNNVNSIGDLYVYVCITNTNTHVSYIKALLDNNNTYKTLREVTNNLTNWQGATWHENIEDGISINNTNEQLNGNFKVKFFLSRGPQDIYPPKDFRNWQKYGNDQLSSGFGDFTHFVPIPIPNTMHDVFRIVTPVEELQFYTVSVSNVAVSNYGITANVQLNGNTSGNINYYATASAHKISGPITQADVSKSSRIQISNGIIQFPWTEMGWSSRPSGNTVIVNIYITAEWIGDLKQIYHHQQQITI